MVAAENTLNGCTNHARAGHSSNSSNSVLIPIECGYLHVWLCKDQEKPFTQQNCQRRQSGCRS